MTESTTIVCPARNSCLKACVTNRTIELEPEIFDDDDGGHRVGYCYQCHPAEPFEVLLDAIPAATIVPSDKHRAQNNARKPPRVKHVQGELSQEDVARVFGVTRQTVIRWEKEQTKDDSSNTSNPWGYYKSLRTNQELRDAFEMLSNQAKAYIAIRDEAKNKGKRFRMTFESFKEDWHRHNNAKM